MGIAVACAGIVVGRQAQAVAVVAQQVHRMRAGTGGNALALQALHDVVARQRRTRRVHIGDKGLPGMLAISRTLRHAQPGDGGQFLHVPARPMVTLVDEAVQLAQLHQAHRALQIGHAVVEAQQVELGQQVRPRALVALLLGDRGAVVAQHVGSVGQLLVLCGDHAAFTGGDRLARMERERRRQAQAASRYTLVAGARRAGRILDDWHTFGQHAAQRIHVDAQAEQMHSNHGLGARAQLARHIDHVDVVGGTVNVGQHRRGAAVQDHVGRGHPGKGGHDHLVAGADAHRGQDQVQPGRATGGGQRMLDRVALGKGLFEGRHLGALGQPAAHQRLARRLPFVFAGAGQRDLDLACHSAYSFRRTGPRRGDAIRPRYGGCCATR